jgi:hypothetical protein
MYQSESGKKVHEGVAFTLNEISYPANWLNLATEEDKARIGLTKVPEPEFKDSKWWHNRTNSDGSVEHEQRPLDVLKEREIKSVRGMAETLLRGSDWMVIAKWERNREISDEWVEYRSKVINECSRLEEAIANSDFDSIQAIEKNFPSHPNIEVNGLG